MKLNIYPLKSCMLESGAFGLLLTFALKMVIRAYIWLIWYPSFKTTCLYMTNLSASKTSDDIGFFAVARLMTNLVALEA